MNDQNQPVEHLAKLLNQQKLRLQQVLATLAEELDAIKYRNGTLMIEISEKKQLQLEAIKNADAHFSDDDSINIIKTSPQLTQLKNDITELLVQCQTQNEICYLTASQNQMAVEQVKNLLVGGSKSTTYNEQGLKNSAGSLSKGIKA